MSVIQSRTDVLSGLTRPNDGELANQIMILSVLDTQRNSAWITDFVQTLVSRELDFGNVTYAGIRHIESDVFQVNVTASREPIERTGGIRIVKNQLWTPEYGSLLAEALGQDRVPYAMGYFYIKTGGFWTRKNPIFLEGK